MKMTQTATTDRAHDMTWGALQCKTGRDRSRHLRLWLVERRDRSWFCDRSWICNATVVLTGDVLRIRKYISQARFGWKVTG